MPLAAKFLLFALCCTQACTSALTSLPVGPDFRAVLLRVQQLDGSTPVAEALLSTRLQPAAAKSAEDMLLRHGLETAFDLRLLGFSQGLQDELASELKQSGLPIGDRAKIQLLIGSGSGASARHFTGFGPSSSESGGPRTPEESSDHRLHVHVDHPHRSDPESRPLLAGARRLQADGPGLSIDTLAIVLSVLVGAAGYVLQ